MICKWDIQEIIVYFYLYYHTVRVLNKIFWFTVSSAFDRSTNSWSYHVTIELNLFIFYHVESRTFIQFPFSHSDFSSSWVIIMSLALSAFLCHSHFLPVSLSFFAFLSLHISRAILTHLVDLPVCVSMPHCMSVSLCLHVWLGQQGKLEPGNSLNRTRGGQHWEGTDALHEGFLSFYSLDLDFIWLRI